MLELREHREKRLKKKKKTEAGTAVFLKDPFEFVPSFLQREEWEHESGEAGAVKWILKACEGMASPRNVKKKRN